MTTDRSSWNGRTAVLRRAAAALTLVLAANAFSYAVYGAIGVKWASLGGAAGFLGNPLTDETGTPDGVGRFNHFEHGSIYWTPQLGAWEVHGQIRDKWAAMGWERSFLGYPSSDESDVGDHRGRYSNFQGGTIFWSVRTGPHELHSAVMPGWVKRGGPRGFLGYPVTDDSGTPDGRGRFAHFEGGSIYWSPQTGAHEVHGVIRDRWAHLGWERGCLRYPTSDEFADGPYRRSNFERGYIRWTAAGGAKETCSVPIDNGTNLNPVQE